MANIFVLENCVGLLHSSHLIIESMISDHGIDFPKIRF